MNIWWKGDSTETYWVEITDRDDIGNNLKAPQTNEKGMEFWGYSFIKEIKEGDTIFHYSKTNQAIISYSVAVGNVWDDKTVWAARGTSARDAGIKPHTRDGWYLGLEQTSNLPTVLSLDSIRKSSGKVSRLLAQLKEKYKQPLYFPFESGENREIRPLQGYLFKLPKAFLDIFPVLSQNSLNSIVDKNDSSETKEIGVDYRFADEDSAVAKRNPFSVDPNLVERGLRGHAKTQNQLAEYLKLKKINPRSPKSDEPSFDLAWEKEDSIFLAEVKSVTEKNQEKQLRLGLGQILRYQSQMSNKYKKHVECVIVTERKLSDLSWYELCASLNIFLVSPEDFDKLPI